MQIKMEDTSRGPVQQTSMESKRLMWHVVPRTAIKLTAAGFRAHSAPLLKEEGGVGGCALISQIEYPAFVHRAVVGS
jgi:hypothetical protein